MTLAYLNGVVIDTIGVEDGETFIEPADLNLNVRYALDGEPGDTGRWYTEQLYFSGQENIAIPTDPAKIFDPSQPITQNITLYAIAKHQLNVQDDVINSTTDFTLYYGGQIKLEEFTPTVGHSGYLFKGFFRDVEGLNEINKVYDEINEVYYWYYNNGYISADSLTSKIYIIWELDE